MNEVLTDPGPGVAPGRIVHFVLAEGDLPVVRSLGGNMASAQPGETYPAFIVRKWDQPGLVNLVVLVDGPKVYHRTSAHFSCPSDELETLAAGAGVSYEPGTWHWPPRVG